MSDFAQFSLMVHLIFIQNVPFLIQDIGVINKILDKFYKFSIKTKFPEKFLKKRLEIQRSLKKQDRDHREN